MLFTEFKIWKFFVLCFRVLLFNIELEENPSWSLNDEVDSLYKSRFKIGLLLNKENMSRTIDKGGEAMTKQVGCGYLYTHSAG